MARVLPVEVYINTQNEQVVRDVGDILRGEHGVHGLRLINGDLSDRGDETHAANLIINERNPGEFLFQYRVEDAAANYVTSSKRDEIGRALSHFAVSNLKLTVNQQSSRDDVLAILDYIGERPQIDVDPSIWIANNPLISELSRKYPQYGNLIRYLCNERGLFLKVGNSALQRAYWNSTTNAGLPIVKKADPIHEGTFMLHDLFHFVPTDPLLGVGGMSHADRSTYVTHRLLSEASTLVLADMFAVDDANLAERGYDTEKRRIFPVYASIVARNGGRKPELNKLLAANAHFCFTGDPTGYRILGASEDSIQRFTEKYESIFRDDFLWNLSNFQAMVDEKEGNPELEEYYRWLEANTDVPTMGPYTNKLYGGSGVDIAQMLSYFRADFNNALSYNQGIDDSRRIHKAYTKYLAGQRLIFARHAGIEGASDLRSEFDSCFDALQTAYGDDMVAMAASASAANKVVDRFIDALEKQGTLLPHEALMNRMAVPLYPVKFVNYEKSAKGEEGLASQLKEFTELNEKQLERLLESVAS